MGVECPSCGTEMDARAEACPVCLRKRTRQEMFAGLRGDKPARSQRGAGGAGRALFYGALGAAAIGYVVYKGPNIVTSSAQGAPRGRTTAVLPPLDPQPPAPPSEPGWVDPSLPPAGAAAPAAPAAGAGAPKPAGKAVRWTLRGQVFDLLSLKPVAGAALTFTDTFSGESYRAQSDARGAYAVEVPKGSGAAYQVLVRRRGFKADYLEDSEPSFLTRAPAARREAAREMERSAVLHVPLSPPPEADEAAFNFALVPLP